MFRRILLASAGAMALAGAAVAADLPLRAPPPVFLPPPPVLVWTGCYVGLNAGYTWAASKSVQTTTRPGFFRIFNTGEAFDTDVATSAALATGSARFDTNGFVGGGQIGCNLQFANSWVAGLEADIDGIAGRNATGSFRGFETPADMPGMPIMSTVTSDKRVDYLGTVRGRIGFLWTPTLLIYGTGGLAYGGVETSTRIAQTQFALERFTNSPSFASFGSLSGTRVGWTAGGGIEWMFWPNWSAKVEYLYYDLGRVSHALSPLTLTNGAGAVLYTSASFSSTRFNGNLVRVGLNYHFNLGG